MSEILVLKVVPSTNRHDFVAVLSRISCKKVFFVIGKENRCCSEANFLKDLELTAQAKNIEVVYVVKNSFTRNLITKLGYKTIKKIPNDLETDLIVIDDFLSEKKLNTENKKSLKITQSQSEDFLINDSQNNNPFESHIIRPSKYYWLNRSRFFFLLCFLGFTYGLIFWWFQPYATIIIKPKISSQSILQNIVIELNQAKVPDSDAALPRAKGILVRTSIEDTEIIPAGGRKYEVTNAYGQVSLFNETSEPKFLVPSRLEAAGGLIFRFNENITIPARTQSGPGQISVDIVADSFDEQGNPIGNRGNIIAGTELRFPALRDELQELFYAKANKGPLVGGSTLTRYIIEQDDIERAKGLVLENFRVRGVDELKQEIYRRAKREDGNQVLLENPALLIGELVDFQFPEDLIGQESQTFEVPATVEVVGVVIDQTAVKKIMRENLQKVIDDRQMIVSLDDDSLEYEILEADNFIEENWLKLSVKAIGIEQLDTSKNNQSIKDWKRKLIQPLLGKTPEEAMSRLLNDPDIERISNIKVRPFWQKQIPARLDQIDFTVLEVD